MLSPLARRRQGIGNVGHTCERFELFIDGIELVNAYSEENDAVEQRDRFKSQEALRKEGNGLDLELHSANEEFLEALSYGMPPTAGWGLGIDRLCMLLFGFRSIREVILFPKFRGSVLKPPQGE